MLEPISGYLSLAKLLFEDKIKYSTAYNFGPNKNDVLKVSDVVESVIACYGKGKFAVQKNDNLHEANLLMLNITKAKNELNFKPKYKALKAIEKTVDWYKKFYSKEDIINFTIEQIKQYFNLL